MTPKEKAQELYDVFHNINYIDDYDYLTSHNSKESAKKAVDEILKLIRYHGKDIGEDYSLKHWKEVKQELEKL